MDDVRGKREKKGGAFLLHGKKAQWTWEVGAVGLKG